MRFFIPLVALIVFAAGLSPAGAEEMRKFATPDGEVSIPVIPQRIVSLHDLSITLPLIEMGAGARVVGSQGRPGLDGRMYIRGAWELYGTTFETPGIGFVGALNAIDLEAVARLQPDLIIGRAGHDDALLTQLRAIAPTVLIDLERLDMTERLRVVADAGALLRDFEARLSRYRDGIDQARRLIPQAGGISVALLQPRPESGEISVSRQYYALSQVLDDIGFGKPALVSSIKGEDARFSAEYLPELDGDFIFATYDPLFAGQRSPNEIMDGFRRLLPNACEILQACRNRQLVVLPRAQIFSASFRSLEAAQRLVLTHVAGRPYVPFKP